MIVIADTSPLHYLILVNASDILPELFQRVLIPNEVYAELRHPSTPSEVQLWIANLEKLSHRLTRKTRAVCSSQRSSPG